MKTVIKMWLLNVLIVDGMYAEWAEWSKCTKNCGGGQQDRNRTCIGPFFGGAECVGPPLETQDCNTHNCAGIFTVFAYSISLTTS